MADIKNYILTKKSLISISKADANLQIFIMLMFLFPSSTSLIYVLSESASSANFSWDSCLAFLKERNLLPKTIFISVQSLAIIHTTIGLTAISLRAISHMLFLVKTNEKINVLGLKEIPISRGNN